MRACARVCVRACVRACVLVASFLREQEFRQFSFEEFLWCRTAVGSRNFSITIRGHKRTAMVPQADMLNHFRPRECVPTYLPTYQ